MTVERRERGGWTRWMAVPSIGHLVRRWPFDLPGEDTPEADEIRAHQMASFARHTPINTMVTLGVSLWVTVVLWPSVSQTAVLVWAGVTWTVVAWHLTKWWRRRNRPKPERVSKAGPRRAAVRSALAGSLWGATTYFYSDVPVTEQMFLVITTSAMAAGAATTMGVLPVAASAFAVCGVVPWIGLFISYGNPDYAVLSVMAAIFLFAMLGSIRIVNATFLESIRAKQANAALLAQFHAERGEWLETSDSSEAFALFDADDRLLLWNENYRRILSLPAEMLYRGARRADLLRSGAEPVEVRDGQRPLEAWIEEQVELRRRPDATVIQHLSNGRWLKSTARGTSRGHTVVLHVDITELKERESALRRSEEKFRNLLEGSIQGVYIHRDWRPLFVNQALAGMLGYDAPEDLLTLDSLGRVIAPEDYPRLREYRKARKRGEAAPMRHTARYLRKDGTVVWFEAMNRTVIWDGAPATQSVFIDVTNRVQAEEALRASERRFQDFAEASADWFWEMDADLRFTYVSSRYETVTRGPRDSVLGKTLSEVRGVDLQDEVWIRHLADLHARRPFRNFQHANRRHDGQTYYYLINGKPVFDGKGEFLGYRGSGTDITERKRAEEALLEREVRLRELQVELFHVSRSGAMGHLSSALAHELNQPLAAIMNYAQAGRRMMEPGSSGSPERIHEMLTKTVDQAGRAGEVIRRLRDLFQKGESAPTPESVNQAVEDAASLALIDAARRGIKYKLHLSKDLPVAIIDRIQVQQVVLNLVNNALEAVAASGRRELTIETSNSGGVVEVAVRDTGPGLSPVVAKRLFEPFVTDKPEGLGMGLAISRRIITAHGGRLWTEPNPDGGACFRFTLPGPANVPGES
jgi:PAS domain S-box-containing protein